MVQRLAKSTLDSCKVQPPWMFIFFFQPQSPVFPNPVSPVTTASSALEGVYVQNQQALSAWMMNEEYGIQWAVLHLLPVARKWL